MVLHDYAIIGHKRSEIGRWLGFASLALAPFVTSLIGRMASIPWLPPSMQGHLAAFTLSAAIVYTALYWMFNRFVWRWVDRLIGVPNIDGKWTIEGQTLSLEGVVIYNWPAELIISQRWDKIMVELRSPNSSSYSETASLLVTHNNEAKLSYSYQNHPKVGEPELQKHQGFCELTFDSDRKTAIGRYFNSAGRTTIGRMKLSRVA